MPSNGSELFTNRSVSLLQDFLPRYRFPALFQLNYSRWASLRVAF